MKPSPLQVPTNPPPMRSKPAQKTQSQAGPISESVDGTKPSAQLVYPRGVVKKTWVKGWPRTGNDIKIEEVLQKDQLELAVLSSFQWEEDWLMSKVDLKISKLILVAYAADEATVSYLTKIFSYSSSIFGVGRALALPWDSK